MTASHWTLLALALGACSTSPDASPDAARGDGAARTGDASVDGAAGRDPDPDGAGGSSDADAPRGDDAGTSRVDGDSAVTADARDAEQPGVDAATLELPPECDGLAPDQLPAQLACTGLYSDMASKTLAPGVEPFAPAFKLWSDGAEKKRFIYLPPGTQIDASDPAEWRFPVGTKLFKEFSWRGSRAETRIYWKVREDFWAKTSYHWARDEMSAERFDGGDVTVAGDTYYIPSAKECDQCHKGRTDRVLGFAPVLMGSAGATGLTLRALSEAGLLANSATGDELEIGDDGTGMGQQALGYLHVNCGVSCHNDNPASEAFTSDLYMRVAADEADGREASDFDARRLTIGVGAVTPRWGRWQRIVPGSPERSLLYELISTRDAADPNDQMPPIASRVVDEDGVALIGAWIRAMGEGAQNASP